jgi:hypothetical protein
MMHRPLSLFAAIAAMSTLAACTAKESKTADSAAVDTSAATAAQPNEVTITATEYTFDAPAEVPAGWTRFRLVDSGKEAHHASLFRLTEGKTFNDAMNVLKAMKPGDPPPSWVIPAGGPNAVDPGGTGNATVNLEPGNYMWLCFLPDPKGAPHFSLGMAKGMTVNPSTATAGSPPTPDITVTLSDYKFDWSKPLTAGTHTIEVKTVPGQPHEIEVFKLAPGKTTADLQAFLGKMMQGKVTAADVPPAAALGGIAGLVAGGSEYFTADFTPGDYVVMCFIEDSKDKKPHFMHGMIQTIKVS